MPGPAVERAAPPPESVSALGPPPDDVMAGAKWAYQVALRLAHVAFNDATISQETREKRVMKLLASAAHHRTDGMRYDTKKAIDAQRSALEERKRGRAQAKLTKRPPAGIAKVIPIRRDG